MVIILLSINDFLNMKNAIKYTTFLNEKYYDYLLESGFLIPSKWCSKDANCKFCPDEYKK